MWRHACSFLTVLCLGVMVGNIVLATDAPAQPQQAVARFQRKSELTYGSGDEARQTIAAAYGKIQAQQMYLLKGRPALEQLTRDLRLTTDLPHRADGTLSADGEVAYAKLLDDLRQAIEVKVEVSTEHVDVIAVTVTHRDPRLAAKVANKLVDNYIGWVRTEMDTSLMEEKKILDTEFQRLREKLRKLEAVVVQFYLTNGGPQRYADPLAIYHYSGEDERRRKALAAATKRLDRLRELIRGKAIGDAVILELVRLEELVEQEKAAVAAAEANNGTDAKTNLIAIRREHEALQRELSWTAGELEHFERHLRRVHRALTLSIIDAGMQFTVIQRAPEVVVEN